MKMPPQKGKRARPPSCCAVLKVRTREEIRLATPAAKRYCLEAPIERVTGWDTPYPHALEWAYFPGPGRVAAAMKRVMEP